MQTDACWAPVISTPWVQIDFDRPDPSVFPLAAGLPPPTVVCVRYAQVSTHAMRWYGMVMCLADRPGPGRRARHSVVLVPQRGVCTQAAQDMTAPVTLNPGRPW
jgi:hypothetical protein